MSKIRDSATTDPLGGQKALQRYVFRISCSEAYFTLVFFLFIVYVLRCIDEVVPLSLVFGHPSLSFRDLFTFLLVIDRFSVDIYDFDETRQRLLKRKMKDVYIDFLRNSKTVYLGKRDLLLPNMSGVRYPIDFFVKRFYDRFHGKEATEAFGTYKRVNPDLDLRLQHLEEFAEIRSFSASKHEIGQFFDEISNEMSDDPAYRSFEERLRCQVNNLDFYNLNVDQSSAAGFPFKPGVKRRDCMEDAIQQATDMMKDGGLFDSFMSDHVWYTTGRARMRNVGQDDKGRLIMYAGFSPMLIAMLFVQPIAEYFNAHAEWCAVGMSWMHGGAAKFATFFKADRGMAPKGYRYVSVDIKGWDAHLHSKLFSGLEDFYTGLFGKAGLNTSFCKRFLDVLSDMVNAKVAFPGGHIFQLFQGMKSGWANTANDNTLIHEVIFRCMMKELRTPILHLLYGDDNFMLVPDSVTDEMLKESYALFGCVVGRIHSSRYIGDLDFLSKYVHYRNGKYFTFRPPVETHARLLMPEEFNPNSRERPDAVIAAERALGHLLDNPFSKSVRDVCYDFLKRLQKDYCIGHIFIDEQTAKKHPWRNLGLVGKFPTVPTVEFIEQLYGVAPCPLSSPWPCMPSLVKFNEDDRSPFMTSYETAYSYSRDVTRRMSEISRKRYKKLVSHVSPYRVPKHVYGTHAARLEFAVIYFQLNLSVCLDFGSHPGACAASMLKRSSDVTCVSLKPDVDSGQPFCPYVFREDAVKFLIMDADEFEARRNYTLLHDDVDVLGARTRSVDIMLANRAMSRAMKLVKNIDCFVFTLHDVCASTVEKMYDCYLAYGSFDIVKPHFSHPWRCEFMVCFKKRLNADRMKKTVFLKSLNFFFNAHASSTIAWANILSDSYETLLIENDYTFCPLQSDDSYQNGLHDIWTLGTKEKNN